MVDTSHTAILGAGVIGASWAALFLAAGRSVSVFDPADVEPDVRNYIARAWPTLEALGLTARGNPDAISFHKDAVEATSNAGFVQENVPERVAIKHALFREIEPHLAANAIVASSASGLTLGQMQEGWASPYRFVLGHPFNPPHLIPLVEVMGNDKTAEGTVDATKRFYEDVGKVTIEVRREVPGHVANRLQAAVWREAVHLVLEGVASVEDVDKAMAAGPGLRWAAMGPTSLFGLGAGPGGLAAFCTHFSDTFNGWWDDLGNPRLDEHTAQLLVDGLDEANKGASVAELSVKRDAMILAIRQALTGLEKTNS